MRRSGLPLDRSCHLPAEVTSPRRAREFCGEVLAEWAMSEVADTVQLCVSELVTNAVCHAQTPVTLTLSLGRDLLVEVADHEPLLRLPLASTDVDPTATSGRGLRLVALCSADWGMRSVAGGKIMWFTVSVPDDQRGLAGVDAMGEVVSMPGVQVPGPAGPIHIIDSGADQAAPELAGIDGRSEQLG